MKSSSPSLLAILFDLVGVLLFPKPGAPADARLTQIDAAIGQVTDDVAFKTWLLHQFGLEGEGLAQAMRSIAGLYEPYQPLWDLLPALRERYRLGIINNGTYLTYPYFNEAYHFDQRFDVFVSSALEGTKKPDSAIYLRACQKLGVAPGECLFMDDDPVNVAGARQAGLQAFHWETPVAGFFQHFLNYVSQSRDPILPDKDTPWDLPPT